MTNALKIRGRDRSLSQPMFAEVLSINTCMANGVTRQAETPMSDKTITITENSNR